MIRVSRHPGREISLLFDVFVLNQHLRRLLAAGLVEAGLRADEYAVYSLLFEQGPLTATEMSRRLGLPLTTVLDYLKWMAARGHLRRDRHPRDGRAQNLALTMEGVAEQRRVNLHWNAVLLRLESALPIPPEAIRHALHALDDAALAALAELEPGASAAAG